VFLVTELATRGFPAEDPVDSDSITVHVAVPGATLTPQSLQIRDPSGAKALTREQTDFDFRLIEPASVLGRVDSEPILTALRASPELARVYIVVCAVHKSDNHPFLPFEA
jgi:hypothetical protein